MTRRACIAIDFDVTYQEQSEDLARVVRRLLRGYTEPRKIEVTVIDPGVAS